MLAAVKYLGFKEWLSLTLIQNSKKLNVLWGMGPFPMIGGIAARFSLTSGVTVSKTIRGAAVTIFLANKPVASYGSND